MVYSLPGFSGNVSLLKQKASRYSIIGVFIAILAIIIATISSAYISSGAISLQSISFAQKTNIVLWFLDGMPFVFAIWGQYVSALLSYEASAIIVDQTNKLRAHTELLEQKAAYEATHDSLTGLPNRALFIDRLQQATYSAKRDKSMLGTLILDMDRFKEVNDTLGHYIGDRLLQLLAIRLTSALREVDSLARIGGDEFGFILPGLKDPSNLSSVFKKIKRSLSTPFIIDNITLDVQISVGAALFPQDGMDADTLIQRAEVAMYVAKHGRQDFVIYSHNLDKNSPHRLTLMGELRNGLNNDELVVHYQPQVRVADLKIHAVEALVRWQHPIHGLMPPNEFIPLAERTGLIKDLTVWVLKEVLRQSTKWRKEGIRVNVAVNVSSISLLDPQFPEMLTGILAASETSPDSLLLEITETSIMVDPDRALEILQLITDLGVKLSIDDFGTGYSSFGYLKKLPVSELKIDKSFVIDMLEDENNSVIVNAIIQLGHNLGLQVVAEGVEDETIRAKLADMGCDLIQGFLISKPLAPDLFYNEMKN